MNYVQFHLGDWIAGTSILSATERGVYMDLLVRYYKEERPIMQTECTRIARAYAPEEQEAMHYVLETFFTLEDGCYRHKRCDEEIAKAQAVTEKRKRAADARWAKDHKEVSKSKQVECESNANAMQMQSKCNANGMPTNNQEPITNNQIDTDMVGRDATPPSASESEALFSEDSERIEKPKNGAPECEYKRVADLYNQKLASKGLPSVAMLSASRKAMVKARWNDFVREENFKTADEVIGGFDYYFDMVSASPFLMGTRDPVSGHSKPFQANFDWLMKSANFLKVLEGNYARGGN